MPIELILLALSPIFLVFVILEYRKYRRYYEIKDSIANAVLALLHQLTDAIALFLLMPFFYWLYQYRIFDITISIQTLFIAFILQDFLYYWFHRASHNVHWLWAAHVVHHSSTHMNFTTAFRQSLMYPVAGMWVFWTPMIIIGFEPSIVFAVVALNLAYQFFVHTQLTHKLWGIGKLFNIPSHHRVHHSTNIEYIDKNFAGVLIIWDKLFGTFVAEDKNNPCKYGIVGQIHTNNPVTITFHQWQYLFKKLRDVKGVNNKCRVLFGYPTHD